MELAPANFLTIERFLQIRASSGSAMTEEERGDAFFQHLLALCDVVFRSHDRHLNLLAFDAAVNHVRPGALSAET